VVKDVEGSFSGMKDILDAGQALIHMDDWKKDIETMIKQFQVISLQPESICSPS
jgi:hypothetical protein